MSKGLNMQKSGLIKPYKVARELAVLCDQDGIPYMALSENIILFDVGLCQEQEQLNLRTMEVVTTIRQAALMEGERQRAVLLEMDGQCVGCAKALWDFSDRIERRGIAGSDEETEKIIARLVEYDKAVGLALAGDDRYLKELAAKQSVIAIALTHPTRGYRTPTERTTLLGKFASDSHRKGQNWIVTAQRVITKLEPLQDEYDWTRADVAQLRDYVQAGDSERCREHLRHAYESYKTKKALQRAGGSR